MDTRSGEVREGADVKREDLDQLVTIKRLTGIQLKLKDYEEIHVVNTDVTCIMVSIVTYSVVETARETRFNKKGWKIYTLKRADDQATRWRYEVTDPMWDDDFEPYVYRNYGKYQSQAEITATEEWEKMCHRPGTRMTPLDNLDRQFQGYDYTPGSTFHRTESED